MPKWLPFLPKTWVTGGMEQRWLLPNCSRGDWLLFALAKAAGFRLCLGLAASGCCCCRFRWTVQTRIKRRRGEGKEKRKVRGGGSPAAGQSELCQSCCSLDCRLSPEQVGEKREGAAGLLGEERNR
ncbi:hypothetical protein KY285_032455 [Solanum tuberosum]|nr:hypothetical protein KY285_032455 [Solanum tuberosum]